MCGACCVCTHYPPMMHASDAPACSPRRTPPQANDMLLLTPTYSQTYILPQAESGERCARMQAIPQNSSHFPAPSYARCRQHNLCCVLAIHSPPAVLQYYLSHVSNILCFHTATPPHKRHKLYTLTPEPRIVYTHPISCGTPLLFAEPPACLGRAPDAYAPSHPPHTGQRAFAQPPHDGVWRGCRGERGCPRSDLGTARRHVCLLYVHHIGAPLQKP